MKIKTNIEKDEIIICNIRFWFYIGFIFLCFIHDICSLIKKYSIQILIALIMLGLFILIYFASEDEKSIKVRQWTTRPIKYAQSERIIRKVSVPVKKTVPEIIKEISIDNGLSDHEANRFVKLAWCESKYNAYAKNKVSSASGVLQIIKGTWQENSKYSWDSRFNLEANIETAIRVYKRYGFGAWECT